MYADIVTRLRARSTTIQTQLTLGFGLILMLALLIAVIGYLSLRNLQTGVRETLEKASQVRELSLEIENNFLLARQSETLFLDNWRTIGFERAAAQYVTLNQQHMTQARNQLDELDTLVQSSADLELRRLTKEITTLRPFLAEYDAAFLGTVRHIAEQSRADGLEQSLYSTLGQLEEAVRNLDNTQYRQLVLEIRANEQAYFNTNEQQFEDNVRLLSTRLVTLVERSQPEDLSQAETQLIASQIVTRIKLYRAIFKELVALERDISVNSAIFREVTTDINLLTGEIGAAGESGLHRASNELQAVSRQSSVALGVSAAVALGLGMLTATTLARQISQPLNQLTLAAQQIGQGNLEQPVVVSGGYEVVTLAETFNLMSRQLREFIGSLEQRVTDRTRDLGLATEVGRNISRIRDLDLLLVTAVELIRSRFDLYYTQIYLTDEADRNLVLRAGTGATGQALMSRGHRLPIAPGSINGAAASEKRSIIVADTHMSRIFRANPLLPETRSEMSVPLIVGDRVVGVLDLQSARPNSFSEENMPAFEALAGQMATAVENAHLFAEIVQARAAVEQQARRLTHTGWEDYLNAIERSEFVGYSYDLAALERLTERDLDHDESHPTAAIVVTGEPVGQLQVEPDPERPWQDADNDLLKTIADQIGRQIENLRLLSEADRYRAEAEAANRRLLRQGWQAYIDTTVPGYVYDQNEVVPLATAVDVLPARTLTQSLVVHGEVIGELAVVATDEINPDVQMLLEQVGERLSNHLENLRLSEQREKALAQTEQRAAEMSAINQVAQAVSQNLELEQLLETVYRQIQGIMSVDTFLVGIYDADTHLMHYPLLYDEDQRYELASVPPSPTNRLYQVMNSGEALLISRTKEEIEAEKETTDSTIGNKKISASLLFAPLRTGGQLIGALSVQSYRLNAFDQAHITLLGGIANHVAVGMENVRLFAQTQAALAETEALYQASTEMNSAQSYAEILTVLRQHTVVGGDAHLISLALFNQPWSEASEPLWIDIVAYWNVTPTDNPVLRYMIDDYPAARTILRPNEPTLIEDLETYSKLDKRTRSLFIKAFGAKSTLVAPLVVGGRWIGYVNAFYPQTVTFADTAVRRVTSLTNQAAVSLQNMRLREQAQLRADELAVLNEAGRELTTIREVTTVLDSVHRHISRLMDVSDFFIALYDADQDEVNIRVYGQGEDVEPAQLRRRAGNSITEHVIRSRQPLLVQGDIQKTAKELGIVLVGRDSECWLGVPMLLGSEVIGVIAVQSFTNRYQYNEHHRDLLTAFASQTAISIQNARLFQQTQARAEELTILNEMGRDLTEVLDVNTVTESIYHYISRLMDTTNFYVALYEATNQETSFPVAIENGQRVNWASRRSGKAITEFVIHSQKPLLITEHVAERVAELGIDVIGAHAECWMGVPIIIGDQSIGLIAVQSLTTARLYNEHHLDLLTAVASQTAIAIENARLFAQVQARARREQLLRQITAKVRSAVDMDSIMRTAVQEIGQALGRQAFVYLGDGQRPIVDGQRSIVDGQLPIVEGQPSAGPVGEEA
jgi:GAF domain-containing protein